MILYMSLYNDNEGLPNTVSLFYFTQNELQLIKYNR